MDVVAVGWLGQSSEDELGSRRKLAHAFGASLGLHAALLLLVVLVAGTLAPPTHVALTPVPRVAPAYFPPPQPPGSASGGGGGGGGSPAPAPRRPLEIPRHKAPDPVPVASADSKSEPEPIPVLDAPIQTDLAVVMQASGASAVSIAAYGGGGRGGGLGEGVGGGVGAGSGGGMGGGAGGGVGTGTGRGFGSGAYRPGGGISSPRVLRVRNPNYTGEAMRAKVQGVVELEAVVLPNGTVGEVRVVRSLDRVFGLDREAVLAAREWLFMPGRDGAGRPVPVLVTLILEFRIH